MFVTWAVDIVIVTAKKLSVKDNSLYCSNAGRYLNDEICLLQEVWGVMVVADVVSLEG